MDTGWHSSGFSDLLAYVEMAAVDSGSVTQKGSNNAGAANSSSFPISHSPIDNGLQKTSYSSMLLDLNFTIGSNPWDDDTTYPPHIPQYEVPGLYRRSSDLNSPPETLADIAFQFAPATPDDGKRAQQIHHYEIGNICQEEGSYLEKNKKQDVAVDQIGNNASELRCEESFVQYVADSSSVAASTLLKENHVLDKAEETGIDHLHKTPEQKAKRRKIRPRVVLEGKAKKTPKSNVEKKSNVENRSGKRKYTRKNEIKSSNAPSTDHVVEEVTKDQVAVKSCRRKLKFQYEGARLALRAGSELPDQDTCTRINCSSGTKATQQLAQGQEVVVENFPVVAFDLNIPFTDFLDEYITLPETISNCEVLRRNTHGNHENDVSKVYKKKRTENNHNTTVDSSLSSSVAYVLHGTREAMGCRQSDVNTSPFASPHCDKINGDIDADPLELAWRWPLYDPIDENHEIVRKLERLNINDGSNKFSVPEQNAVVPYGGDGRMVPYEGQFDPIKKRLPRAKVDLDPESDRVWKLLMGIDTSNGVEGTSEDKEKWWEEERSVFRGRADSFIARMHLILGDRGFSKWKGSVLDSVIGVFLTQNVSDHLSSSAFISLAARFPLKSACDKEGTDILVEEPEVMCTVDSNDPINWQEKKPSKPVSDQGFVAQHELAQHLDESFESNVGDGSKGSHIDICESGEMCHESLEKIIGTVTTETGCGSLVEAEDKRAVDVVSSQNSAVSSQNLVNSFILLSAERNLSIGRGSVLEEDNDRRVLEDVISSILGTDERVSSCSETDLTTCCTSKSSSDSTSIEDLQISGTATLQECCSREHTSKHLVHLLISSREEASLEKHQESCSNFQGVRDKTFQHESTPLAKPRNVVDPLAQRDNIMHQAHSTSTNFQGETLHGVESTLLVDKSTSIDDKVVEPNSREQLYSTNKVSDGTTVNVSKAKGRLEEEEIKPFDWDSLRKEVYRKGLKREKSNKTMDSLDWEAVRCADVGEIAKAIKERGMNNILAGRIKDFLNRLVSEHESLDLEWLRDVPPDKAKDYLLSIRGLGLKSTECVRLLTLHHLAFPVDTNVGRIAVRLGWVPLQPLPESLQLHLLQMYPLMESIQKYLWPRLCTLDQPTLYELHYQMITFGKVFCTKSQPNCNVCPMRAECRHFASAFASARLSLPGPEEKGIVTSFSLPANQNPAAMGTETMPVPLLEADPLSETICRRNECEPIIEEPETTEDEFIEIIESDIEDVIYECPNEVPSIDLSFEEFTLNSQNYMQENNKEVQEGEVSKALVALTSQFAAVRIPKLKNVNRLRTEHQVYELPDSHPLLEGVARRDPDDHCSYLLAIWTPGETAESIQPPERCCSSQESGNVCNEKTCFSCNSIHETNSQTVRGTLLIPCRTAMRGSFPLNGTYFQVNEVFADHETSLNPINVPRAWIWNLPRRSVLFGTSVSTIFKGLSTEEIQSCFWKGYVCVRGFDRKIRVPRPLVARLHFPASKITKNKTNTRK